MKRRDFLLAVSAVAALPLVPRVAQEVWNRVATAYPPTGGLSEAHLSLVSAIADTIIPRTDTPGAVDVGVPAWIDLMVTDYYTNAERAVFLGGLDAIDALALNTNDAPLATSAPEYRERVIAILDRPNSYERFIARLERSRRFAQVMTRVVDQSDLERLLSPLAQRARAYLQLKELVVHGYFTSERVRVEVLKTEIMPGRFDGAALISMAGSECRA